MSALAEEKFPQQQLIIQSILIFLFGVVASLVLFHHLFNKDFYSWDLYRDLYLLAGTGVGVHLIVMLVGARYPIKNSVWIFVLAIDVTLVTLLLIKSALTPTIFLFFYISIILVAGLFFQVRGALLAALASSIGLSLAMLLGPELKSVSYFFFLIMNNSIFFVAAGLTAYLSEQLEIQGLTLGAVRKLNQSMIDSLPVALLMMNSRGQTIRYNPQAEKLFGLSDLEQQNMHQLLPLNWDLAHRSTSTYQQECRWAQGQVEKILRIQFIPQLEGFEKNHMLVIEDLTHARQMEFALRQSEKLAAIGQLAAGIAHEIRNPLAGISGSIELLSQQAQTEEDKKLKKIILREIDRLNRLISEFLDFARPDQVPTQLVDIVMVLRDTLEQCKNDPSFTSATVIEFEHESGLQIRGHSDKLKQAFLNIVINAFQAMDKVTHPVLKVRIRRLNHIVDVMVSDNGSGMTPETVQKMFEPFMTTKPKGTGLGLAITHKILQSHQAQVFVESSPGRGTEIHVHFPLLEN